MYSVIMKSVQSNVFSQPALSSDNRACIFVQKRLSMSASSWHIRLSWYWVCGRCDPSPLFFFVVCFLDQLLRTTVIQIPPRHLSPLAYLGWRRMIIYRIKRWRPSNVCSNTLSRMKYLPMLDGRQLIPSAIFLIKAWYVVNHGTLCKPKSSVWSNLKAPLKMEVQRWERVRSEYFLVVRIWW